MPSRWTEWKRVTSCLHWVCLVIGFLLSPCHLCAERGWPLLRCQPSGRARQRGFHQWVQQTACQSRQTEMRKLVSFATHSGRGGYHGLPPSAIAAVGACRVAPEQQAVVRRRPLGTQVLVVTVVAAIAEKQQVSGRQHECGTLAGPGREAGLSPGRRTGAAPASSGRAEEPVERRYFTSSWTVLDRVLSLEEKCQFTEHSGLDSQFGCYRLVTHNGRPGRYNKGTV